MEQEDTLHKGSSTHNEQDYFNDDEVSSTPQDEILQIIWAMHLQDSYSQ